MKRKLSIVLALVLLLAMASCATTGENVVNDEKAQDLIISIASEDLAYIVGRNNPQIIEPGIAFASAFAGAAPVDLRPLVVQGLAYLHVEAAEYPMAADHLTALLQLFDIDFNNPDLQLTARQVAMIKLAAASMQRGFQLAKQYPK